MRQDRLVFDVLLMSVISSKQIFVILDYIPFFFLRSFTLLLSHFFPFTQTERMATKKNVQHKTRFYLSNVHVIVWRRANDKMKNKIILSLHRISFSFECRTMTTHLCWISHFYPGHISSNAQSLRWKRHPKSQNNFIR